MHAHCPRRYHNHHLSQPLGIQDKSHKPVDNAGHILQKQVPQKYFFPPKAKKKDWKRSFLAEKLWLTQEHLFPASPPAVPSCHIPPGQTQLLLEADPKGMHVLRLLLPAKPSTLPSNSLVLCLCV